MHRKNQTLLIREDIKVFDINGLVTILNSTKVSTSNQFGHLYLLYTVRRNMYSQICVSKILKF